MYEAKGNLEYSFIILSPLLTPVKFCAMWERRCAVKGSV